jgi:hypothetical protein
MTTLQPAAEALRITLLVTEVLESLDVPYALVGSLASSFHGFPRSTNDADLAVALRAGHVAGLARALRPDFYLSEESLHRAITRQSHSNLIHLATMFKVDLFVVGNDRQALAQMARARRIEIGTATSLVAASAEDTVVRKLLWYREGGEVSERQWRDVVGMLQLAGSRLDHELLGELATALGVAPLLARAQREAIID